MTGPKRVVWLTLAPDTIARGYWDEGLLEGLFSGDVWAVPGGHAWEHVELVQPDDATLSAATRDGAVLVIPARHHADPALVDRLVRVVREMRYCLLVLCGDEEGAFPVERFLHRSNVRVWVMTPQPERDYGPAYLIGSGWPPGIRDEMRAVWTAEGPPHKTWNWTFAGQVTHDRREDCVNMLKAREDYQSDGTLIESAGFTQGVPQESYWSLLATAKVAPAPSGPCSPDSFRVFEALEAGCIPIADDVTSDGRVHGFWARLFGAVPFPTVEGDWAAQSATIDWLLDGWPANANRIFAWWQRQKRRMAWRLHDDVAALTGTKAVRSPDPAAAITALITSSPSPKHPDTADLEQTVESIVERLPGCEIVLVFDGVRPELEHHRAAYEEYTRRALWLANTRWRNVIPVVLDDWHHQANATRLALDEIASRLVLFVEHDTPLTREIDWAGIVQVLDDGVLDVVRLHHETEIGPHHAHMMLDEKPVDGPVPYVRTYQWSQRPHVAPVGWYRAMLQRHFAPGARTMIEDVMHGVVESAWLDFGIAGWSRFRVGMYTPEGNIQRSLHLDSRRRVVGEEETGDPKGTQLFAYPGDTPPGAPAPGWR